ncbi:Arm DNA-binding domain-containing protein [Bradyrhizobium barranii]|uniref:Arm DNA-binding domain-containing protein n=1 Tax=Bradyrhizobium barranii TaxID=2992140 RepID=UPI0039C86C4A
MAKMAFSDVGLRSISPPPKGQICYWDDKLPSFGFRVSQGGSKTFVLNRKNSLITIGRFPTISLSQARTEAKRQSSRLGRCARSRSRTQSQQSRPRNSAQGDKWSFCLTAGTLCLRIRSDNEQKNTPEPHTGLQGEGGARRREGRSNAGSACRAVRRPPQSDHGVEGSA